MNKSITLLMMAALLLLNGRICGQNRTEVTDVLNLELTGVTGTTYTEWSGKTSYSDAVYAGQSAGGNSSIQLRSNNNNSGIITTASGGVATSIVVTWHDNTTNARILNIYGSHTAYTSPTELYDDETCGTLLGTIARATDTELLIEEPFEYIGMRSASGAMYLTEIDITWSSSGVPTVAMPTFSPAGGTYSEAQTVTISCETEGATIYYTTDGSTPDDESTVYSRPITISETTTIKAIAFDSHDNTSYVNTATYTIVDPNASGGENNPYTVAQARQAIDDNTGLSNVYVHGIVSEIVTAFNAQNGYITYNISDDGATTSDQLQAYRGKGLNGANFTSADDLVVGDIVTVFGTLQLFNQSVYELNANNYLVSIEHDQTTVSTPTFTPEAGSYTETQEVTIACSTEGATIYYSTASETGPWSTYTSPVTISETSTLWAYAALQGLNDSPVASAHYVIVEPATPQTFTRINNHAVEDGQTYLIVDVTSSLALTAVNGSSSAPAAVAVTIDENNQIVTSDTDLQWTFESTTGGYVILKASDPDNWLYTTDANNGVRVGTNDNKTWTLNITDANNPDYHGFKNNATSRYLGVYNNQDWRAYTGIINNIKNSQIELFVLGDQEYQEAPSITADNVEIAYDATSVSIAYTINNPATDGVLTASITQGDWLTLSNVSDSEVLFRASANTAAGTRTATVTLSYTYDNQTVNKNVTVTQAGNPNLINTISEITAAGDYHVEGTIVAINARGFIVGDGTGYVYYYSGNGFDATAYSIGDMVSLNGSVVAYNGVFEFNNSTTVSSAQSSNYSVEQPTAITGEEMDACMVTGAPVQLSSYVQYQGTLSVSGTHYNITNIEGASTAKGSISYPLDTEFTALDGSTVKVTGYFIGISSSTYYNTMIGTVEEVAGATPVITANDVVISYDATAGSISYTIANPVEGATLTASTDASWISGLTVGDDAVSFTTTVNDGDADRMATVTLSYAGATDKTVTVTQGHYVIDYAELPFSFDGDKDDIDTVAGLTQSGLGSYTASPKLKFDNTGDWLTLKFNGEPVNMKFDIKGNSFSEGTFTVQTSVDGDTYTDLEAFTELSGTTATKSYSGLGTDIRYIRWIYTEKVNGNVALGNIYVKYEEEPPTPIEINPTHTLANAIVSGRHYIIVGLKDEEAFAVGNQNTNNRAAVGITIGDGVAEVDADTEVRDLVINGPDANGNYTIYDTNEESTGYLYAASNSSNQLKTRALNSNANSQWSISFDENGAVVIVAQGDNTRNTIRFNTSSNPLFSCYAESNNMADVYLYVRDEEPYHEFFTDVTGYSDDNNHWQLIASPITGTITTEAIDGLVANDYDLYAFEQTGDNEGEEWRNSKASSFGLMNGKGYLYANSESVTLHFIGQPVSNGDVNLSYANTSNTEHNGWNLIGNPFGQAASLSDGRSFYVMNDDGSEVIPAETNVIEAMQGIFVVAQNANDSHVTFTTTTEKSPTLSINLYDDNQLIDRAVIRFDNGEALDKIAIDKSNAHLYFSDEHHDYAVIKADGQNEFPLQMNAKEGQQYTITVSLNNVELNRIVLTDTLTGEEVNLTETGAYTFTANAKALINRFKIIFLKKKEETLTRYQNNRYLCSRNFS